MSDEVNPVPAPGSEAPATPTSPPAAPPQFSVDSTALSTMYANFCRVTGTPEELVLDFGLNTQMSPTPTEPIRLSHRLVLNYFTAKRLASALYQALQQHESVYGVLEVDVQKRARMPRPGGPGAPGAPPQR